MLASFSFHQQISKPNPLQVQIDQHFNFNYPIWKRRQNSVLIRCSRDRLGDKSDNYYEFLGVSVDASPREIKDAYRKLQKKYHPDVAGQKGHESTLLLNKAYKVLMRDDTRKKYDASIGRTCAGGTFGSTWKGPLRPQALFVDENACIGCRECVHEASNTFMMDEAFGTARVKVQYGDDDGKIQVSVDSCPVNCIHWVDADELAILEHLIQPRPKTGYGIYGQGWERPANVFMAAKSFNKQLKEENQQRYGQSTHEEESPAQAEARESAYREMKNRRFASFWSWVKTMTGY